MKTIGSWTSRTASQSFGSIIPAAAVLGDIDLSYNQSTFEIIGGVDAGKDQVFSAYDAVVFGLMGGYISSNVNFKSSPTSFKYTGGTVGLSGSYINNGFFADALIKADFLNVSMKFPSLADFGVSSASQNVTNLGGLANFGYRWDAGPWYLEPIITVQYVQTKIGSFALPGLTADFPNGEDLRIGGGARVGAIWISTRNYEIDSSATAKVWDIVVAKEKVTLVTDGSDLTLSDKFDKIFGEVSTQINITNKASGWTAFTSGSVKFNSEMITYTGKGGVRYEF